MFSCSYQHSFHWRRNMMTSLQMQRYPWYRRPNKHGIAPTHVSLSLFCLPVFPMYGYVFIGRKCSHQHYENKSAPHEALSRLHTLTVCTVRKERGDLKLVPMKIRRQWNRLPAETPSQRPSPGQRRRHDVFIVLHVMPGLDRNRDLLRPCTWQCENPTQNSETWAYCMYCLHLSCPHLLFLHSEVVKGYEFGYSNSASAGPDM